MIGDYRGARDTVAPWLRSPDGDMMAYGLLCGVMVAQGRFGEARQWLGRAGHMLKPEAEPGFGVDRTVSADLISQILDLLAQPGKPAPAPSPPPVNEAGGKRTQAIREGMGRPLGSPTVGEARVLRYLPTHLRAAEIADELNLSPNTVKTHVRHLYQKLGARSRSEAVERARAFGLLASSPRSG